MDKAVAFIAFRLSNCMTKKSTNCKHCNMIFADDLKTSARANHSRWCDNNPKRKEYINTLSKNRCNITEESIKKRGQSISKLHEEGAYNDWNTKRRGKPGRKHSDATKELMSKKARASPHRRLRKKMIEYKGVMLDSTWELYLAERLDELEIKWVRPEPMKWSDREGKIHNYFADFYLPDHDLYLDPKNPFAIKVQKEKLDCLLEQYGNIYIIDSEDGCKQFILDSVAQLD